MHRQQDICNIIATWNGTTKTVPVTWKNYPYLSVSTSVEPLVIGVNQTVNVTIGLKGDGWALGPRPADVVIVTNLAGGVGEQTDWPRQSSERKHLLIVQTPAFPYRWSPSEIIQQWSGRVTPQPMP